MGMSAASWFAETRTVESIVGGGSQRSMAKRSGPLLVKPCWYPAVTGVLLQMRGAPHAGWKIQHAKLPTPDMHVCSTEGMWYLGCLCAARCPCTRDSSVECRNVIAMPAKLLAIFAVGHSAMIIAKSSAANPCSTIWRLDEEQPIRRSWSGINHFRCGSLSQQHVSHLFASLSGVYFPKESSCT